MKVTGLAVVPPPSAANLPRVTPELLASVLARYSRSNEGLATIIGRVDLAHPDESIDRILKFVDYGHASIGGLTDHLDIRLDLQQESDALTNEGLVIHEQDFDHE